MFPFHLHLLLIQMSMISWDAWSLRPAQIADPTSFVAPAECRALPFAAQRVSRRSHGRKACGRGAPGLGVGPGGGVDGIYGPTKTTFEIPMRNERLGTFVREGLGVCQVHMEKCVSTEMCVIVSVRLTKAMCSALVPCCLSGGRERRAFLRLCRHDPQGELVKAPSHNK